LDLSWAQEVRGSNPRAPTNPCNHLRRLDVRQKLSCDLIFDVPFLRGRWFRHSRQLADRLRQFSKKEHTTDMELWSNSAFCLKRPISDCVKVS
jgi:hypothetical protein